MEKKRTAKEYKQIIWDTVFYLIANRKDLAKQLEECDFNEGRTKYFRFGTATVDKDGYIVEIKICE